MPEMRQRFSPSDLEAVVAKCDGGSGTRELIYLVRDLAKLIRLHHNVIVTGHLDDWGKDCPVCRKWQELEV